MHSSEYTKSQGIAHYKGVHGIVCELYLKNMIKKITVPFSTLGSECSYPYVDSGPGQKHPLFPFPSCTG